MKALGRLAAAALLGCGLAGCGKADKVDNSANQTPSDQPIGMPKAIGGGKTGAQIGDAKGPGKKLPSVELKP